MPRYWAKACCPQGHCCGKRYPILSPRTISTPSCRLKSEVSCCLLMRNVRTNAQMGGAGSLREGQRENKRGFLWWVTAFGEIISEGTTKSPAPVCPRLALCTEENVANEVPSHIWQPTSHAQGRGLRRSQAEPGTLCTFDNLHIVSRCLQGTLMGGLKILGSSSPFLLAVVFFNSHSLNFQIKSFLLFFFYCSVMKINVNQIKFLSVKNLLNLERKQIWPSLVPLLVSRVASYSVLIFCFLHHLCSSQFYTQSPGHSINMPLSKKKVQLSLSP